MSSVLLCYLAALVILSVGFFVICLFLKKGLSAKWKAGPFFGGILLSAVYFLGALLLFRLCFANDMYYNTALYRILVGFVLLMIFCFIRFLILKLPFFDYDRENAGFSLAFGFGAAPAAFLWIYSLLMLVIVAANGIFNGPCIVEESGLLSFADNTVISVFRPVAGHISFAVLFSAYALLSVVLAWVIKKITDHAHRSVVNVIWAIAVMVLETVTVLPVLFMQLPHWSYPIIAVLCTVIAVALVKWMPIKKEESDYIKQFD